MTGENLVRAAASGKILGIPRAAFFGALAVIAAGVVGIVWKMQDVPPKEPPPSGPIDVNTASVEQLKDLPGVSKKVAEDIVAKRPFADVDDLKRVKGIGDKKIEAIRALVTAGK